MYVADILETQNFTFWKVVSIYETLFYIVKETDMKCSTLQVIESLLDTNGIPRKPQYNMAPEIPLVLQSCDFDGLKFTCSLGI